MRLAMLLVQQLHTLQLPRPSGCCPRQKRVGKLCLPVTTVYLFSFNHAVFRACTRTTDSDALPAFTPFSNAFFPFGRQNVDKALCLPKICYKNIVI